MKTRKIKTPRQELIKDCDTLFSKIIRQRDPICVYCGKRPSQDAAHIFSRRKMGTRWCFHNAFGLCKGCHRFQAHIYPLDFLEFARKKLGEDEFNKVRATSMLVKTVRTEDLSMIKLGLTKYWAVSSRCSREEERECPYPIKGDDGTISDCIKQGHCACDEGGTK